MTERNGTASTSLTKSPAATGLVLLFLIGHAFLVTATHFHRDVRPAGRAATHALSAGLEGGGEQQSVATAHAQCLLCRLQRNFICDLEQGIPATLAPPARKILHGVHAPSLHSQTSSIAPSGRAPPSA